MLLSTVELTLLLLKTKNSLTRYFDDYDDCDDEEDDKTLDFRCGGLEMSLSTWLKLFNGMGR